MTPLKTTYEIARDTIDAWLDDDASTYAAAISLYTMISLAPVLTLLIKLVSVVFSEELAQERLLDAVDQLAGVHIAALIQSVLQGVTEGGGGTLATLISIGIMLFGATGVFAQLHTALNKIWRLDPPAYGAIKGFLTVRMRSLGMVMGAGFALMFSIAVSTTISIFAPLLGRYIGTAFVWQATNMALSLIILTTLFAMVYRYLPTTTIQWKDTWIGAAATSILFVLGKSLIGFYLGTSAAGSAYGAAGSLVAFLLWVFYSAQVVLIGAEFTWVWARRQGRDIEQRVGQITQKSNI